jgi:hypothetical protein
VIFFPYFNKLQAARQVSQTSIKIVFFKMIRKDIGIIRRKHLDGNKIPFTGIITVNM